MIEPLDHRRAGPLGLGAKAVFPTADEFVSGPGKGGRPLVIEGTNNPFGFRDAVRARGSVCGTQAAGDERGWRPVRRRSLAGEMPGGKPRVFSDAQLRRRRETDAEGFIHPSYNATGGPPRRPVAERFHELDINETLVSS